MGRSMADIKATALDSLHGARMDPTLQTASSSPPPSPPLSSSLARRPRAYK